MANIYVIIQLEYILGQYNDKSSKEGDVDEIEYFENLLRQNKKNRILDGENHVFQGDFNIGHLKVIDVIKKKVKKFNKKEK